MLSALKGEHSLTTGVKKDKISLLDEEGNNGPGHVPAIMGQGLGLRCGAAALAEQVLLRTLWANGISVKARRLVPSLRAGLMRTQVRGMAYGSHCVPCRNLASLRSQSEDKTGVCETRKQGFPNANPGRRESYKGANSLGPSSWKSLSQSSYCSFRNSLIGVRSQPARGD